MIAVAPSRPRWLPVLLVIGCAVLSFAWRRPLGAQPVRSVVERFGLGARPNAVITLPDWLREVSGLAVASDGRVITHGDERGVVAEIDLASRTTKAAFSLGRPPIRADLEGVAVAGSRVFLSTSDGALYETSETSRGAARFTQHATGFGARCELEGLGYDAATQLLLIGCKVPREKALEGFVTIFRWSIATRAPASPDRISVPLAAIVARTGTQSFRPSAVEIDPGSGHLVVLAGPERAVAELTTGGDVVDAVRLAPHHRQPEGLTFVGDSLLLVADEGGKHHATLSLYRRAR